MKKGILAIILVMVSVPLFAQGAKSGEINFIFDKTNFTFPIETVSIRKHENIFIEIKGIVKSEIGSKDIFLRFSVQSLLPQKVPIKDLSLNINYYSKFKFSIHGENARFSSVTEQFNYQDISTTFFIDKVSYENDQMQIIGSFSGIYSNNEGKSKDVSKSEIQNGNFIILF